MKTVSKKLLTPDEPKEGDSEEDKKKKKDKKLCRKCGKVYLFYICLTSI